MPQLCTSVPIFFRRSQFVLLESRRVDVPFDPCLPGTGTPRTMITAIFESRKRDQLDPFAVVNCHLIPGAKNAKAGSDGVEARLRQYRIE